MQTFWLDNSMDHSRSWEANSSSVGKKTKISRILWNLKVHYRLHISPPPAPILRQINTIHAHKPYWNEIHFNIIPIYSWFPTWSLSFWFTRQNSACMSVLPPMRSTCLTHLILLNLISTLSKTVQNSIKKLPVCLEKKREKGFEGMTHHLSFTSSSLY